MQKLQTAIKKCADLQRSAHAKKLASFNHYLLTFVNEREKPNSMLITITKIFPITPCKSKLFIMVWHGKSLINVLTYFIETRVGGYWVASLLLHRLFTAGYHKRTITTTGHIALAAMVFADIEELYLKECRHVSQKESQLN